jgi:hypothetical protein
MKLEHLSLADVLRYHQRVALDAKRRSTDARASRHTKRCYELDHELHSTLAEVVRTEMVRIKNMENTINAHRP